MDERTTAKHSQKEACDYFLKHAGKLFEIVPDQYGDNFPLFTDKSAKRLIHASGIFMAVGVAEGTYSKTYGSALVVLTSQGLLGYTWEAQALQDMTRPVV